MDSNYADKKCCVRNCGKSRSDGVILHSFPQPEKDPARFRSWLYAIGGDILGLDNQKIFKYRKVCHDHFEPKFYTTSKRLSANAVPTINVPGVQQRLALMDVTNRNIEIESSTVQSIPTIDIVAEPKPSTSKDVQQCVNITKRINAPDSNKIKKYLSSCFSSEASIFTRQIKKLQASKDRYAEKLRKAMKLTENTAFQKATKNFTSVALMFTLLQFREINKNKMGRRFTKREKIMALSLYKQGPRAYRWLRNIFVLPSPMTLNRMISLANLNTGINENIFKQLKKIANGMKDTEKFCILLFDEISIAPHFQYNKKKDRIIGFVDNGTNIKNKIADHALVFMIRGVQVNYKQPISYTFCAGSTPKEELVMQIKNIIKKIHSVGLKVVATVCDQGASNTSAINYLIRDTKAKYLRQNLKFKENVFEVEGEEVVPLYDPPHLIKGIRNNLLSKKLVCTINKSEKTAEWDHIVQLYREDPGYRGIRLLHKLTESHVIPAKIKKMKVKCATQVFSERVAVNMGYLADKGILDSKSKDTADVLLFFDELFDSVNGGYENAKKRPGKRLLGALTPNSCHHKVWKNAKAVLQSMKFIDRSGRKCVVPSIKNWLATIENLQYLSNGFLKQNSLNSIWLRHFNQDPLENFFGCIRSHGARNTNPTCAGFEVAFSSLLVNSLNSIHSPGSNCEKDFGQPFKSLKRLFFSKTKITPDNVTEVNFDHIYSEHIFVGIAYKKNNVKIFSQVEYVTGYILRKLKIYFRKCVICKEYLFNESRSSDYISRRDYSSEKIYLSYPSEHLTELFSNVQDVVSYIIKNNSQILNIKNYIKTVIFILCDFSFIKCKDHKDELTSQIVDISCNFFLYNWCKDTNKLLRGLRDDYNSADEIQTLARNYFIKRKK